MNKLKVAKFFRIVFLIIAVLYFIVPFIIWFKNPELTQMQVFKRTWVIFPVSIICIVIVSHFDKCIDSKK